MIFTVWHIVSASAAAAAVAAAIAAVHTRRKCTRTVEYMMDALDDGELGFRFRDTNRFNRALNRIRTVFDKQRHAHEQDSWTKLIRVLTHEIMNTVSPISSLSEALASSLDEDGRSPLDMRAGLETISESSKNLIKFVQTYRELSGVARPVKRAVGLRDMLEGIICLNREFLADSGADCVCSFPEDDIIVYADEGQISQIFLNLIKNAVQAGAHHVSISGRIGSEDVVTVDVSNDGAPVPKAAQEQIFVPFYTTKSDGSGIGLSISRQIMIQHNGSIDLLKSDSSETVFRLEFR